MIFYSGLHEIFLGIGQYEKTSIYIICNSNTRCKDSEKNQYK